VVDRQLVTFSCFAKEKCGGAVDLAQGLEGNKSLKNRENIEFCVILKRKTIWHRIKQKRPNSGQICALFGTE
jgi:hypothetical protein